MQLPYNDSFKELELMQQSENSAFKSGWLLALHVKLYVAGSVHSSIFIASPHETWQDTQFLILVNGMAVKLGTDRAQKSSCTECDKWVEPDSLSHTFIIHLRTFNITDQA